MFYGYLNELKHHPSSSPICKKVNTNSLQSEIYDGSEYINPLTLVKRVFNSAYTSIMKNRFKTLEYHYQQNAKWSNTMELMTQQENNFHTIVIVAIDAGTSSSGLLDIGKLFMNYIHYIIPVSATKPHQAKDNLTFPLVSRVIGTEPSPPDARGRKYFGSDPCTILETMEHSNLKGPLILRRVGDTRLRFLQTSFDHETFSTIVDNESCSRTLWTLLDRQVTILLNNQC